MPFSGFIRRLRGNLTSRAAVAPGERPDVKRIVCLANSRKRGGRCVAGKELLADGAVGEWVRPVSSRPDEEVSERERRYTNGKEPDLLDVIDVPVQSPCPRGHQQENWRIDPQRRWTKARGLDRSAVDQLLDPASPLWINGHSARDGLNDRFPLDFAPSISGSLRLIEVPGLQLVVSQPRLNYGDDAKRVRGEFLYEGDEYRLSVTDPAYEQSYRQRPNGSYSVSEAYLTISLGEPFQNPNNGEWDLYKLIAGVIPKR